MYKIIWNFILLYFTLLVTFILSDKANANDNINIIVVTTAITECFCISMDTLARRSSV